MDVMIIAVTFESGNAFGRYHRVDSTANNLDMLDAISAAVSSTKRLDDSPVASVSVKYRSRAYTRARSITFTNICGKIMHTGSRHSFRESILPFVQNISNGFGHFRGLFGMRCNLVMCGSNKCTLFRGATASSDISEMIEHSLYPDCIADIYVHMLCATFRVGKPIYGAKNDSLAAAILNQPYWSAHMQMQTEEKAYMVSFKMESFDRQWLATLFGDSNLSVNSLLININWKGSVNCFLAVNSATKFCLNIETAFQPLLEHVRMLIVATT